MAPQADPQSGKCSCIDPLSFIVLQKLDFYDQHIAFYLMFLISILVFPESTFSFGAIWDLFLEESIAFCDGFDIILKYDSKKRPSKYKMSHNVIFHEK